jgi:zinc/manganese transport system substrate-binding protein
VTATKGVTTIEADDDHDHDHGHGAKKPGAAPAADPHAWQSIANAKVYVANIRDGLVQADPAGAADYTARATAYLARLDALEAEVKAAVARIPTDRRRIITSHDAFGYFGRAYGIALRQPPGRLDRDRGLGEGTWRASSGRSGPTRSPPCSSRTSPIRG